MDHSVAEYILLCQFNVWLMLQSYRLMKIDNIIENIYINI